MATTSSGNTGRRTSRSGAQFGATGCPRRTAAPCTRSVTAHAAELREAVAQVAARRLHRRHGGDRRARRRLRPMWRRASPRARRSTASRSISAATRRSTTGAIANNGWLQELPKPMTKLTWDNAALIAPATAEAHELQNGDIIAIAHEGRTPEHAGVDHSRPREGFDHGVRRLRPHARRPRRQRHRLQRLRAARLDRRRTSARRQITRTGDDYDLVGTQDHWSIEGRNIVRSATLDEFKKNPAFVKEMEHVKLDKRISLYADDEYRGQQWGMAIDMNACTGCTACVIACVAENNIPGGRQGAGEAQPRDALAAHRSLLRRRPRTRPTPTTSRCPASSARTRPAKWCARCRPPFTAPKA